MLERGNRVVFSLEDMFRYHGSGSPGGVAHAFKVLERGLPLLAPGGAVERREIAVATPFAGPGARDVFELVTRAVSEHRYELDRSLACPRLGLARERFVFRLRYRDRAVDLRLREGFVTVEFVELAGLEHRSSEQEQRLTILKAEMAERVLGAPAKDVYDAVGTR